MFDDGRMEKNSMKSLKLVLLMLLFSSVFNFALVAKGQDIRFEGIGTGASESLAMSDAYQNAMSVFLKEHFPVQYSVEEEVSENQNALIRNSKFRAAIGNVEIDGIKVEDVARTSANGVFEVKVRYSVPRSQVLMAQKRLSVVQPRSALVPVGGADLSNSEPVNLYRSSLVVNTTPQGALVTIDDSVSLPSPFQLNGFLDQGEHTIRIDHPAYNPVELNVQAVPGKTIRINEKLSRATVAIRIESLPDSAILTVDGKKHGQTPVTVVLEAGRLVDIRIDHPDAKTVSKKVKVIRDPSSQTIRIPMEYHPTYVQVVGPEVAGRFTISMKGKKSEITRGRLVQVDPGQAEICFSPLSSEVEKTLECGKNCCKSIDLKPGRQNLMSFHRELREQASVAPVRELKGEVLEPIAEENSVSSTSFNWDLLPSIRLQPKVSMDFDFGIDSVSIKDENVNLYGIGTSLRLSVFNHLYADLGVSMGAGDSSGSSGFRRVTLDQYTAFERAFGVSTSRDGEFVLSIDLRSGGRKGTYVYRDPTPGLPMPKPQSFSQELNGVSIRLQGKHGSGHSFVDYWSYSSSGSVQSGGSRLQFGMGVDF